MEIVLYLWNENSDYIFKIENKNIINNLETVNFLKKKSRQLR